ncbi:MAG: hypothetical protein BWY15_01410 [Firmicutes bacterium ADurb.Bin193]|nr:MAG: hypothetical protein BWY15_01410 [Firmicutes bacterium ADurb.Bin193]
MEGYGKSGRIVLVNTDITSSTNVLIDKEAYVVTYGLNSRATLTVSSIEESKVVLCLQRSITDLDGRVIEPQEFSVYISGEIDAEMILLMSAVLLISGVSLDRLSEFVF